jgi:hypothetical protein
MEHFIRKILAAFGLDSESLKKLVTILESNRKEYDQKNEETKRTGNERRSAKENEKE